ncbi:GTP 3',8-cyclase MoaA [Ruminococcaceae bacterium OttesenSCG-928-A11]|nr:GTP 3',8-cyclase MoaA [Ruminococcaceae bacterium OttesenSCG-928-A11]
MKDSYGRNIHYLRVSVTDRCNLRCRYCMPEVGVEPIPHEEILTYDEILRLVRVAAGLGIDRIRLTGGEPLVRKGLVGLAADIKRIPGIRYLGLTTNGVLLSEMAPELLEAGVDGVNVSIDTLDEARYAHLTRRDALPLAIKGMHAALALPFRSVKVNSVLAPDSKSEDWLGVLGLAKTHPVDVRLIEWMPMAGETENGGIRANDALALIEATYGELTPAPRDTEAGPAQYWRAPGFAGRIGIIHAMSHNFCDSCNRLRLTATGNLKLCLFYDVGVALKPMLRSGASDGELAGAILSALENKPKQHGGQVKTREDGVQYSTIAHAAGMYQTGG